MRIHFNLAKALRIIKAVERGMQLTGLHVHGLNGDELESLTTHALTTGQDLVSSVKALKLEAKAALNAPEVPAD